MKKVYEDGQTKNPNIKIKATDKYLVLSTCREEDETIRSNLYLRQIPDSESFLYGGIVKMSFDGEQKMGIWLVLLRWGPIYSIMNISVFGGVLWI